MVAKFPWYLFQRWQNYILSWTHIFCLSKIVTFPMLASLLLTKLLVEIWSLSGKPRQFRYLGSSLLPSSQAPYPLEGFGKGMWPPCCPLSWPLPAENSFSLLVCITVFHDFGTKIGSCVKSVFLQIQSYSFRECLLSCGLKHPFSKLNEASALCFVHSSICSG